MTKDDFRAVLTRLGLSQIEAAKLFRVNPRTVRKWVLGERRVPGPVIALLELAIGESLDEGSPSTLMDRIRRRIALGDFHFDTAPVIRSPVSLPHGPLGHPLAGGVNS